MTQASFDTDREESDLTSIMKNLLLPIIISAALGAFATDASAKSKPHNLPPKPPAKPVNASSRLTITAVSSTSISVKTSTDTKTYSIDGHTSITLDGRKVAADALKSGMGADVTPSGLNPSAAISIAAVSSK